MPVIEFRVNGTPKGQPRPRAFARKMGQKFVARVYDDGSVEGWKGCIALAARPHIPTTPITGPVKLELAIYLHRPQRFCRKCDVPHPIPAECKPDADNAAKAVMDALTVLGFWKDDAQVVDANVYKWYSAKGENPGAVVKLTYGQAWPMWEPMMHGQLTVGAGGGR